MTTETWTYEAADFRHTDWMTDSDGVDYRYCEEKVDGRWEGFVSIRSRSIPRFRELRGLR